MIKFTLKFDCLKIPYVTLASTGADLHSMTQGEIFEYAPPMSKILNGRGVAYTSCGDALHFILSPTTDWTEVTGQLATERKKYKYTAPNNKAALTATSYTVLRCNTASCTSPT
jgi:hypothetical protein